MNIDIEHLKQVALAASPGPWLITEHEQEEAYDANYTIQIGEDDSIDDRSYYPHAPSRIEDARFIAAANPAVVLELVAEVERLRAVAPNSPAREAAERQSIDTPEFRKLLTDLVRRASYNISGKASPASLIAYIDTWGARRDVQAIPDVLFDGKAVYDEIVRKVGKAYCGNPSVVADTLDAVVRLIRRGAAPAAGNIEKPKEDP